MKQLTVTVKLEGKALLVAVAANCANATAFARGEITRAELESRRASTGNGVAWGGV